jgi:competence protein ComEC
MPSPFVAECYFLDVGQGTSQVINLGGGSAIVIDCGPSFQVLGDLLRRQLRIQRIAALILSHNHSDHIGGVPGLVRQYRKAIDQIYLLQDQPAKNLQNHKVFAFLRQEVDAKNIPEPIPLLRHPKNVWLYGTSPDPLGLELLFPSFLENIEGQASGNQNHTCAVLLLRCGSIRVLFPGDAEIDAWRANP